MLNIVIWGCNDFAKALCEQLQKEKNITVLGFVGNEVEPRKLCEKPVYHPDELSKIQELMDIPVVIAAPHAISDGVPVIDFESIRQYKIILQQIVNNYSFSNHLLHPAALIDFVNINYKNKIITFGMPDSGNTLLNQICHKISEIYNEDLKTRNTLALFFENLCFEYTQIINQVIQDTLCNHGGDNIYADSWKVGTTHFNCLFKGNIPLSVFAFPTRDQVFSRAYGYHQLPSRSYLNKLNSAGFNTFFIMRNPLDMIISSMNRVKGINHETKKLDWQKFCRRALIVFNQLNYWYPLHDSVSKILHYEDLINDPIHTIVTIMRVLKLRPSPLKATNIWKEVSAKKPNKVKHAPFLDGKRDNWENYFQKEHLSFLKKLGIEQLLEKYKYEDALGKFRDLVFNHDDVWLTFNDTDEVKIFNKEISKELTDPTRFCTRDENYETLNVIKEMFGEKNCTKLDGINYMCSDQDIIKKVHSTLSSNFITKLISSGIHPNYKNFLT